MNSSQAAQIRGHVLASGATSSRMPPSPSKAKRPSRPASRLRCGIDAGARATRDFLGPCGQSCSCGSPECLQCAIEFLHRQVFQAVEIEVVLKMLLGGLRLSDKALEITQ